jgi:GT2 family glycosyltransferase
MDASVIIATKGRPLELAYCLRALARQDTGKDFEVIVVDDGTSPMIRPADLDGCPSVRLISSEAVGPAKARNRGIDAARAPLILFTDDDTAPCPRWVETACRHLDEHAEHVGVEGPVESPPFDPLYERSLRNHQPGAFWTCNIAYRRDALAQLGGFADIFPSAHGEDLDLAFRALRRGPIGFANEMVVTHYPTSVRLGDTVGRNQALLSDVVLYRRHPERFRTRRIPLGLMPAVGHVRYLRKTLRKERAAMIGTPRRLARFLVASTGQMVTVLSFPLWSRKWIKSNLDPRDPRILE